MHQVDNETSTPVRPPFEKTIQSGWFTKGGQAQAPTYPGADWFNMVQAEAINLVEAAGFVLDKADVEQWAKAVVKIAEGKANDAINGLLVASQNLADVASKSTSRQNLDVPSNAEVTQAINTLATQIASDITSAINAHNSASNPHPGKFDGAGSATNAVSAHVALPDPHPNHYDQKGSAANAVSAHIAQPDPHPNKYDSKGAATAIMTDHLNAPDPHPQYNSSTVGVFGTAGVAHVGQKTVNTGEQILFGTVDTISHNLGLSINAITAYPATGIWRINNQPGVFNINVDSSWSQGSGQPIFKLEQETDPNDGPTTWETIAVAGGAYNQDGRGSSFSMNAVVECHNNQRLRITKVRGNVTYHEVTSINISKFK